jgi:hypothetical protein
MLGDAARFAGRDPCLADRIHERGLAVVDVPHESDDGGAELEFFSFSITGGGGATTFHDLMDAGAFFAPLHFKNEAVFVANLGRDLRLDGQVGIRKNVVVVHQLFDELEIFQAELGREVFDNIGGLM